MAQSGLDHQNPPIPSSRDKVSTSTPNNIPDPVYGSELRGGGHQQSLGLLRLVYSPVEPVKRSPITQSSGLFLPIQTVHSNTQPTK